MSVRSASTLALLFLAGCAPAELRSEFPADDDLEEFEGAFHLHLDPSKSFEDNLLDLDFGWAAGMLDFAVLVDDGLTEAQARELFESKEGRLFIPAVELENGLLAVGLRRPLPLNADADEIRRRGGLAILRKPKGAAWDSHGADGVELYDLEETVARRVPDLPSWRKGIPDRAGTEVVAELDDEVLRRWDELNRTGRLLGIASHSTHHGKSARLAYTEAFPLLTVHVHARKRTREAILEGLRRAQCSVFFNSLNGYSMATVVVDTSVEEESRLVISWSNAIDAQHHVFLDGRPLELETLRMAGFGLAYSNQYRIDQAGAYRVRSDLPRGGQHRPWFLTNPVRALVK